MSDDRAFERAVDDWLADGSDRTPRPVVDAVFLAIKTTPQSRDLRIPWRTRPMSVPLRLAAGIAVVAIVGFAALTVFTPGTSPGSGPTPAPSATLAPTPSPSLLPAAGALEPGTYDWIAYYTPVGGARFTVTVPEGWATAEGGVFVYRNCGAAAASMPPFTGSGEVLLAIWTVSHVYTDACHHDATLVDAGTTIDELASLLVAQKGRVASAATDVTLGGFPAKRIELTVPADLDVTKCDGGIIRFWPDPGPDESGGLCCTAGGSTDVVYVVDVAGDRFAVVARHQASSSAEELAELQAIVDSIKIEPPAISPSPSGASPSS